MRHLPGSDLIEQGLAHLERGEETVSSLLVSIGATRLSDAGLADPPNTFANPELRLYALLADEHADSAHSRYNALTRRLVSFERALACVG